MRILVPLKRVVDPYAKVKPLGDGSGLSTQGLKFEINPFDEIAIEESVRLREKLGNTEIIVISIGSPECEEQLRKALAMGADQAILVETTDIFDSPSVADELNAWVLKLEPNLVLMGKQATDDDCNQVGQMLAAKLNWPQATFASKIEVNGSQVLVTRETDTGDEVLQLDLPAVITADLRLNEPRYIALPGIIKARSKPLDCQAPLATPRLRTRILSYCEPPPRIAGQKVDSVDALILAIKARGAL